VRVHTNMHVWARACVRVCGGPRAACVRVRACMRGRLHLTLPEGLGADFKYNKHTIALHTVLPGQVGDTPS
jgi:hypothetical protein